MEKLELKHLAPYLPYKLMISIKGKEKYPCELEGIDAYWKDTIIVERRNMSLSEIKPILRPLSDLTMEESERLINDEMRFKFWYGENGKGEKYIYKEGYQSSRYAIQNDKFYDEMPHYMFQDLIKWHFDVFGLIDKGLAIDINTLKN